MSPITEAQQIAMAIYAVDEATGRRPSPQAQSELLYLTIDQLGYSDEFKAELYARLAENLTPDTSFSRATSFIADTLRSIPIHGL